MSKRASQSSPTSPRRSLKKQKLAPPGSSPPQMSVLSETATPILSLDSSPQVAQPSTPVGMLPTPLAMAIERTNSNDQNPWSKVEKRKHKKQKHNDQRAMIQPPSFAFNLEDMRKRDPITIGDIRELTLHLTGDAAPPNWLRVTNRSSIKRVVVLLVPGITDAVFVPPLQKKEGSPLLHVPPVRSDTHIPFLSTFLHAVPTRAPGDAHRMHSIVQGFFMGPITGEEKRRRIMSRIQNERAKLPQLSHYVLTPEQLIENEYPTPRHVSETFEIPEDWLETGLSTEEGASRVLSLDCEMCVTEVGKELTRVCIIDYETGDKLYDELVKPTAPITDYLTRFSGITAEKLQNVTTRLVPDVHEALKRLITPNTILLGHSLESDLKALHLAHGRCIDTSVIYHHPRGKPLKPGLAWLTKKWVGREIQTAGEGGHDPEEDARACIDLLRRKVQNGPGFGEFQVDTESILERMTRGGSGRSFKTGVVDYGQPQSWLGSKATSTIACKCDQDVVDGMSSLIPNHEFVFGRMMELSESLGWTTSRPSQNGAVPAATPLAPKPHAEMYQQINSHLQTLYKSFPPLTAFLLFTGHSDPTRMAALSTEKNKFEKLIKEGVKPENIPREEWWTSEKGRELEDEVAKTKHGLLFIALKHV